MLREHSTSSQGCASEFWLRPFLVLDSDCTKHLGKNQEIISLASMAAGSRTRALQTRPLTRAEGFGCIPVRTFAESNSHFVRVFLLVGQTVCTRGRAPHREQAPTV